MVPALRALPEDVQEALHARALALARAAGPDGRLEAIAAEGWVAVVRREPERLVLVDLGRAPRGLVRPAGGRALVPADDTPAGKARASRRWRAFLSHAVADTTSAIWIAEALLARGVAPWIDAWELRDGDRPRDELVVRGLFRSKAFVLLVGARLTDRQRFELGFAQRLAAHRRTRLVVARLPSCEVFPELPGLAEAPRVSFREGEKAPIDELIACVRGEAGR